MFGERGGYEILNSYFIPWGINILVALGALAAGRIASRILLSLTERILLRAKMEGILVEFSLSILNALLWVVVVVAALDQLGFDTTSLIAILGAAGLAVGLALKDSLQNFAAGVMLIVFRPFKAGDYIEAGGTGGVVEKISIFNSIIRTPDNREITVPNGGIYGGAITNYSARDTRRIDLTFGIGYDDSMQQARDLIREVLAADERILKDPAAVVAVSELADSSVNFVVRPWVATADYWPVRFDLIEGIKTAFDEGGISIPFPQRDVHIYPQSAGQE